MPLAIGTRIGAYEVTGAIGAGGMGEVYRARDTRLGRDVAIKILPAAVSDDGDRRARFEREAKTLAALNHPNIAHLHGIEERDGILALVMELVEGEDLSALIDAGHPEAESASSRLRDSASATERESLQPDAPGVGPRRPERSRAPRNSRKNGLPLTDALSVARQIADALEAAHEQGIIHRDLKPQNVKVKPDGMVKVLDFGLAKALTPDSGPGTPDSMDSPTLTNRGTQLGVILGTAAYMAPEQARGKTVDKRADIWAFGVVVYEMLTGQRAFAGDEISDVLAAVLRQDINWSALPAGTPTRVRRLLERCLDRDVKTRLRDIGEARVALASPDRPDAAAAAAPQQHRRAISIVPATAIAIVAAIASALGVSYFRAPAATSPSPVVRLPFDAPNTVASEVGDPTISPDGKTMLFTGRGADGRKVLWVRALDSGEAKPLPDTDDAIEPFWSWDSKSIAFGAQGKLKRLDLGETRAKVLTDAGRLNNGSWSRNGVIVFSPDFGGPLFKVSASGGERTQVVPATPGSGGGRYPAFLPDGKHFLFSRNQAVFVGSLDATDPKHVLDMGPAVYAPPGWLLYVRNGIVVAHRFDTDRLELIGDAHPIAPAVSADTWARGARLSVSETGVLVMGHAPAYDYQLAWFDRNGRPAGTLGPVRPVRVVQMPRISPDGSRVVVQIHDTKTLNQDLWLGDLASGSFDRLTTAPEQDQVPAWAADGASVFASTSRNGVGGIYRFPIGGGQVDQVSTGPNFPMDASRDGWLYFIHRGESTRIDIWALRLDNGQPVKGAAARVIVNSEFDDNAPQISPDGQWLAYQSDVTGTYEVYVRRMTDGRAGPAVKVTTGHGMTARWSRDGNTLFFASAPQGHLSARMMSVRVTPAGDRLQFSAPTPLFNVRMMPSDTVARDYDIAPDGRFLVGTVVGGESRTAATVVLNWPAIVK